MLRRRKGREVWWFVVVVVWPWLLLVLVWCLIFCNGFFLSVLFVFVGCLVAAGELLCLWADSLFVFAVLLIQSLGGFGLLTSFLWFCFKNLKGYGSVNKNLKGFGSLNPKGYGYWRIGLIPRFEFLRVVWLERAFMLVVDQGVVGTWILLSCWRLIHSSCLNFNCSPQIFTIHLFL